MEGILKKRIEVRRLALETLVSTTKEDFEAQRLLLDNATQSVSRLKGLIGRLDEEVKEYTYKLPNPELEVVNQALTVQVDAEDLCILIESAISSTRTQSEPQQERVAAATKMPKLEMPSYDGNILRWTEFWDRFNSSVHSKQIAESEKMTFLVGCLKGEAKEAVAGLSLTDLNYNIAVETLKARFGSTETLVDAHYSQLCNLPRAECNSRSCRNTLNEIERHLRVLETLGEPAQGNQFRAIVLRKFPDKVVHEHHLTCTDGGNMVAIRSSLNRIITAMEKSSEVLSEPTTSKAPGTTTEALHIRSEKRDFKKFQRNPKKLERKRKGEPMTSGLAPKKPRRACIFCGRDNHASTECRKYKTIEERKSKLSGRCLNCLRRSHSTEGCQTKVACFRCKGEHPQVLCPNPKGKENDLEVDSQKTTCSVAHSFTFLQTAVVKTQNPQNSSCEKVSRLLLDSGSQRSYMTRKLADTLQLKSSSTDQLLIYTFGSTTPQKTSSPCTEVEILTKRGINRTVQVNIVTHITDRVPVTKLDCTDVDVLADDDSVGEGIDILIGNDFYCSFLRNEKIKVSHNIYLIDTDFGFVLSGSSSADDSKDVLSVTTYCQCHTSSCPYFSEPDLPLRNVDIKFLWSMENLGITDSPKATRQEEAVHQFNETVEYKNRRYEVKWPWIQYPPDLPSNFGLALGRLKSLLRRIGKESLDEYNVILREQEQLGIIEVVDPQTVRGDERPIHYLPHHMIKEKGKKGRIVYDASAKTTGRNSLNECLYSGPYMLEDLTALLIKFRTKKIGITADVEKAFLQVGLQEEDRDVTRFLWLKDTEQEPRDDNLLHFRFCRVPFGVIASPFLLTATVKHHMNQSKEELIQSISDKCYVDNLVTGANSKQEAQEIYQKTRSAFSQLSMNLRDWVSNDEEFLNSIPKQHQADQKGEVKVLGLLWDVNRDTLKLKTTKEHFNPDSPVDTKRNVLRALARIYDPCGFVCPLVLPIKLLFKNICEKKYKWDTALPEDIMQTLKNVLNDLKAVTYFELPRQLDGMTSDPETIYDLHGFSDASKDAFAAVVFIRISGPQGTSVSFIMGKSHVAQNKDKDNINIPRQELLGFLITSRLVRYVKKNIDLPINKEYLWTDSLVVLGWMRSNKLLPPFVTNRVKEIKSNVPQAEWYYVNTKTNPADVATRPETWQEKKDLWYQGPEFLKHDESHWPETRIYDTHHSTLVSVGEALEQSPGEQLSNAEATPGPALSDSQPMELDEIETPSQETGSASTDKTVFEIRRVQRQHFSDELTGKKTHLTRNLDLFLDGDGLLRSRGRIANASLSYETKYPILLPKESEFTNSIIKEIHEKNYHVGAAHTLGIIREKYWIPQGKAQVQKVIRRCAKCIKHGGGPYKLPPAPALPAERVTYNKPFTYTGIDYFGPLYASHPNGKVKRWVALFTCLTVRAIHLEVVNDLTAEECLLAVRRFTACRNTPKKIYSDNATYFKLTSAVLEKPYCIENNIMWKFIPQLAPWHGAFYERLVAIVKNCLKRTLDKHLLNDSQLLTVIKEVEAVVNSRPLTKIGTEVEHVLRPADFLSLGRCLTTDPSPVDIQADGTKLKADLISSWKRGLKILEEMKQMFIGQYLTSLRERFRHDPKQPRVRSHQTPRVGDLVQLKSEEKNRNNWKMGKIVAVLEGADGECRVAKVKVNDSILTRSIGHLYPLEADTEETPVENAETPGMTEPQVENSENSGYVPATPLQPTTPPEIAMEDSESDAGQAGEPDTAVNEAADVSDAASADEGQQQHNEAERNMRGAAIRAREKIREWTRLLHLVLE